MATYSSQQVADQMPISSHGLGSTRVARFPVALTAAVTTADVIRFGYLPIYARVVDATLMSTDIDTNAGPTVTINVGDAGDVDRLFAVSTVGQAGTVARMSVTTGFGYRYDAETLITGAFAANAATGVAGTLTLFITYVVEDTGVGYPA